MKLVNVSTGLSKIGGRTALKLRQYSPEILMVTGIVGIVGSTILACRATLKVDDVLQEHTDKVEKIEHAFTGFDREDYSADDHKRDLTVTYIQTGVDFVKLYGPSVSLGIASIGCIISAHGIMRKRNVALMAAYKAVEEGFAAYRKRVIEEHGEDADYMYRHGLRAEQVTEVDENGKKVKKTQIVKDPNGLSVYAKYYDEGCKQWSPTADYNLLFLKSQQDYHNEMLKARGHLFLNEVYDALGIERTKQGAVVGWVLGEGDDFVDFGFSRDVDFMNGRTNTALLDFNVDGVIYDLI